MKNIENIEINIGGYCGCDCIFCGIFKQGHFEISNLGIKEIKQYFLPKLKDTKQIFSINFNAIESTTNPDFPEIIKFLSSFKNVKKINLITNGIRVYDKTYLDSLFKAGLTHLIISIHSFNAEKEAIITGNKTLFHKKILSIKNALEIRELRLSLNFVINVHNYNDIRNFILVFHKMGVRNFNIFYPKTNSGEENGIVGESWVKITSIDIDTLIQLKNQLKGTNVFLMDFPVCIKGSIFSTDGLSYTKRGEKTLNEDDNGHDNYIYTDKCKTCDYYKNNGCKGIGEGYYQKFGGEEFNPIISN